MFVICCLIVAFYVLFVCLRVCFGCSGLGYGVLCVNWLVVPRLCVGV